jgi:Na+/H+ antiporter NhaA
MTIPPRMRDRPTADLIVFALTALVIVVITATTVIFLIDEILYPDRNHAEVAMRIGQIISSLIAAIVGYLAGRGVNGKGENRGNT